MEDKGEIDETGSSDSALRGAAEENLGKSQDASPELADKTSEAIIHSLEVHEIEQEMQDEELKSVQNALDRSKDKYQDLYDFAPVGYFTLTPKGLIAEVNLTGAALLGMPRPKLIKRGFGHFVSPNSLDLWDEHIISVLGHEEKQTCDLRLIREDESTFYARLNSIRIVLPDEWKAETGETDLIHTAVTDVTDRMWAEKELRESEERYRTVADFTYDWEYWVDPEGNFLYVSPSCERITGYSAQEFLDDPSLFDKIVHPDDLDDIRNHLDVERKVVNEDLYSLDFRIIHQDGHAVWVSHACRPVYGKEGQPLGRRVCNRDITERKQSEEEIRLNESRLQCLYEISQYKAYNVQDFLNFTLDHAIRLTGSRFGFIYHYDGNKRRFILNSWSKDVMTECEIAEPHDVNELVKTGLWGEAVRQKKAVIVNDFQAPNLLKKGYPTGHVELFKFMTVPVFQEDSIVAVIGVANKKSDYDDSDVRQLSLLMDSVWRMIENQRGFEQERLLFTAIGQSADAIIITDATGTIQYVNHAQATISGYSLDELVGQTPNVFKNDFHDGNFYKQLWETVTAGKVWSGRFINKKRDGSEYHEDATISPVYDKSGNLTNFVVVEHDVTTQLQLQEQLVQAQKMEAVGTLAGGMAHDFNNLLQVVLGYSELMLLRKKEEDTDYVDINKIFQAGKRGTDLVKSLLIFSRKVEPKYNPINLNQEILQVQSLLSRTIPKIIKIDLHLGVDLGPIKADQSQIGQILMNLGINARDAMPDGGTLTIETANRQLDEEYCNSHPEAKPGSYVLLTVSDTGRGMDTKTLSHIFEPFFTTKGMGKGTGLGLAIVYGIVKNHDGHIICYSEPGQGATFKIYLPIIQTQSEPITQTGETPIEGGTETILFVEDEEDIMDLGTTILDHFGYKVISAGNGKEALEIYEMERDRISLILLDLIMPVMDGRKCLAEILRIDPNAKVITTSGFRPSGPANWAMSLGAKGFVQKPYDMRQLLTTIRKALDNDLPRPVDDQDGR
jgi:two-component system cell cycle sensor histidine kinase/response regulator CckA